MILLFDFNISIIAEAGVYEKRYGWGKPTDCRQESETAVEKCREQTGTLIRAHRERTARLDVSNGLG